MRTLLSAWPDAVSRRMRAADYAASEPSMVSGIQATIAEANTPWDPRLAHEMTATGAPAFEEVLPDSLLTDLQRSCPPL